MRGFRQTHDQAAISLARIIWDGENQGIGPKLPDHLFRGHFVSGSGGLGTRLGKVSVKLCLGKALMNGVLQCVQDRLVTM